MSKSEPSPSRIKLKTEPEAVAAVAASSAPASSAAPRKQNIFLVKIPKYLGDHLRQQSALAASKHEDIIVGTLSATSRSGQQFPDMKINIDSQAPDFPRDYSLVMIDNESTTAVAAASAASFTTPYYAFKETRQANNAVVSAMEGPVRRFFNAKPDNTPEYRAMSRARLAKASTGKRPIQMVSQTDFDSSIRQSFARTNEISRADGAVAAAAAGPTRPAERRVRDAERIGPDILQAFREQPFWRMELLAVRVNQPVDFVKENLSRYAKQVTQGDHRYSYELREEYRMAR